MSEPHTDEKFVRLPEPGETCPHTSLTREEMINLITPTAMNGGDPPLRGKTITAPGKKPIILVPWLPLSEWILRQDHRRSYETPRSFYQWVARFPSCHLNECPVDVIQITNLFQTGEEPQFQKAIDEQISMNRRVFVLYTRKGAAVAYRKR